MLTERQRAFGREFHSVRRNYIRTAALATMCGVTRGTVLAWLRDGKIPKPAVIGTKRSAHPHAWSLEQARRIVEWHKSKAGCS